MQKIFGITEQLRPLLSKSESHNTRWQLLDKYMLFYFRFIYSHQDLIELGNYDILKLLVLRDYYPLHRGKQLNAISQHRCRKKATSQKSVAGGTEKQ